MSEGQSLGHVRLWHNRPGDKKLMGETVRRAALATLVAGGIVVLALALWQLRLVVALLFLAFIIAAAMRPTVDALAGRGLPVPPASPFTTSSLSGWWPRSSGRSCRGRSSRSTSR